MSDNVQIDTEDIVPDTGISTGRLCKECCNNELCVDRQCPVYQFRNNETVKVNMFYGGN